MSPIPQTKIKALKRSKYAYISLAIKPDNLRLEFANYALQSMANLYDVSVLSLFNYHVALVTSNRVLPPLCSSGESERINNKFNTAKHPVKSCNVGKSDARAGTKTPKAYISPKILSCKYLSSIENHNRHILRNNYRLGLLLVKLLFHQSTLKVLKVPVIPPLPNFAIWYIKKNNGVKKYRMSRAYPRTPKIRFESFVKPYAARTLSQGYESTQHNCSLLTSSRFTAEEKNQTTRCTGDPRVCRALKLIPLSPPVQELNISEDAVNDTISNFREIGACGKYKADDSPTPAPQSSETPDY